MNSADQKTIQAALDWARQELSGFDTGSLDSRVLLCHCLARELAYLMTWPDKGLSESDWQQFQSLIQRRKSGEPVAYLTGHKEFWDLDLMVSQDTLIPRPETEHLVEWVLTKRTESGLRVLDLGTGTGAIALALAKARPQWHVTGVDLNNEIVALARQNASRNRVENVSFQVSHWFEALAGLEFDLIVSNPPYIDENDPWLQQGDVRFEPDSALVSGNHGLADIELISRQAVSHLMPGGVLIFEHGYTQGEAVRGILLNNGYSEIRTLGDLAGLERVTVGCR